MMEQLRQENPSITFAQSLKYSAQMYSKLTSAEKEVWIERSQQDIARHNVFIPQLPSSPSCSSTSESSLSLSFNNNDRKRKSNVVQRVCATIPYNRMDSNELGFPMDTLTQDSILHDMIKAQINTDSLLKLIAKYPNAVKHKNKDGCYPLHFACIYTRPYVIVTTLYDLYKPAIQEKDRES
jgi:hypothetical protein